jgi:aconitase A
VDRDSLDALNLVGSEEFTFEGVGEGIAARRPIRVNARRASGEHLRFDVIADVRSAAEADFLRRGGMFQAALEASLE